MDASMALPSTGQQGVTLAELVTQLRRRAWLVVLCALLGTAVAVAFSRTLPKLYTASSRITIGGQSFAIPELQGALRSAKSDPMLLARTQLQELA